MPDRPTREPDDRLRFALRTAGMVAYEWDVATLALATSEPLAPWLGFPTDIPVPTLAALAGIVHPDDRGPLGAAVAKLVGGSAACETEFRVPLPDGTETRVACRSRRVGGDGGPDSVAGVMRNVTEQRRADGRLRMLESAVVHARDAVVILEGSPRPNAGRHVLYANAAFCEMSGYAAGEVIGRSLHYLRGPDSDPATLEHLRDALDAGAPYKGELLNYRKTGEAYWVELSLVPVPGEAGQEAHWVMIQRDIGDRKRAEAQLFQAQKMELIGQMAGGIAHDFNNLLTGIIGNLSLAGLPPGDPARRAVETALRAAHQAADLTRKLLGFARKNQLVTLPMPVDEIVREAVGMVSRTFGPRIRVRFDAVAVDRAAVDPTLISQVLLNLCMNARDAMPDGGEIALGVQAVDLDGPTEYAESRAGRFVRVTVQDDGEGMTPEVRAKIFEPFFTTKPVGKGTGLGLAMVHGIMTQHNGWVECRSRPGWGTRFDLYLPRVGNALPPRKSATVAWPADRAGAEAPPPAAPPATIMTVDDEEMIRDLLRTVLEAAGHTVIECEDGEQAVEAFRGRHAEVDLVILDLTMPKLTGQETFRQLHAIDPTARVLLSSGYSNDDITDLDGILGLLPKPYRPTELLATVARALAMPKG